MKASICKAFKSCVSWPKKGILSFFKKKQENLYNLTIKLGIEENYRDSSHILGLRQSFLVEINGK